MPAFSSNAHRRTSRARRSCRRQPSRSGTASASCLCSQHHKRGKKTDCKLGRCAAEQARSAAWAKTGVIALRGEQPPLAQLPPAALAVAAARVADFGNNALEALPAALGGLAALQRLRLSWNRLSAGSFPSGALAPLQRLTVLALDHNRRAAALMQSCLVLSAPDRLHEMIVRNWPLSLCTQGCHSTQMHETAETTTGQQEVFQVLMA